MTEYKAELLPPEPLPLPVKDSLDSLVDIIDYLQQQYERDLQGPRGDEEEENYYENRPLPSPEIVVDDNAEEA